ncbi:hypothetical protein CPIN17260_1001 [Campylobacter pinnipediorum subsp. pinnipediorum]|uniref:hypothetical protein n=1 Tax=Campylobacter pinnipediorum TaxID=1965231 RepID=UPI000995547E|nr:hypothetical protein [Campylobacter pinnipediorum]AQW81295.1 hypothetical protein CPIN17260_1001 [Campylobacter pinnipediorum subsp. pinnipediorum]
MSKNNDDILKQAKREVRNAMNRTLTRAKQEQINMLFNKTLFKKQLIRKHTKTKRAEQDDLDIKIFTYHKRMSIASLPKEEKINGVEITISRINKVVASGFALQKPRSRDSKFLISSKANKIDGFIVSTSNKIPSSYKTKEGIKFTQPRNYNAPKKLKKGLVALAIDETNKLLKRANEIFEEELRK